MINYQPFRGVVLSCAMIMAGCAEQSVWIKPDGTPQSFQSDQYDCKQKIFTMYGGVSQMGFGHAVMLPEEMRECLRARGWSEHTAESVKRYQGKFGESLTGSTMSEAESMAIYQRERARILKENAEYDRVHAKN